MFSFVHSRKDTTRGPQTQKLRRGRQGFSEQHSDYSTDVTTQSNSGQQRLGPAHPGLGPCDHGSQVALRTLGNTKAEAHPFP